MELVQILKKDRLSFIFRILLIVVAVLSGILLLIGPFRDESSPSSHCSCLELCLPHCGLFLISLSSSCGLDTVDYTLHHALVLMSGPEINK